MELMAAVQGLSRLTRQSKVRLLTDSRYLKDGISKWSQSWELRNWRTADNKPVANQDLWQALLEVAKKHDIHWMWVRGHAADRHNGFVDLLARDAIKNGRGVDVRMDRHRLEEMIHGGQISW
jgi:ribonuclease HI